VAQAPREWAAWSPIRLRTEASNAERGGQVERAIALLEAAIRRAPDDGKSVRHLANLLTRAGHRQAANEHYRRLAEHYERDQLHGKAIAVWKIVLSGEPGFVGAHIKLGELYALEGLRADARKHYGEALARYRASGRRAEAAEIEARIDELDRQSDPGLRRRGHDVAPPPAAEAGAKGLTADERRPSVSESGAPERSGGDADDAEFVNERLQEGRLFRRYGLRDQAHAKLVELLARLPDHAEGRRELCDLLVEMGRHEEAAEQERLIAALESGGRDPLGDLAGIEIPAAEEERPSPMDEADIDPLELEPLPPEEATALTADTHLPIDLDEALTPGPAPARTDEKTPPEGEEGPTTGRGLRELVDGQVGRDDYETRYDLGIAYREMGLLDEAIAELQLAARGPDRLLECASLLAACFREKGLPQLAVKWLERALATPGLDREQEMSVRYDLASALEARGEASGALEIYVELYGEDAGFRDVAECLRRMNEPPGGTEAAPGAVLQWRKKR
jgi:tetratricopeptide (TPR) repeat protein